MVFAKKNFHQIERVYPLEPSLICFFSINCYRKADFSEDLFPRSWVGVFTSGIKVNTSFGLDIFLNKCI
jgi:hypothetical protein